MKRSKINYNRQKAKRPALPVGACRVIHPVLGVRVWFINGKYYRSRADYQRGQVVKDGISVDTSIQIEGA